MTKRLGPVPKIALLAILGPLLLVMAAPTRAADLVVEAPESSLGCLVTDRGKLSYPSGDEASRLAGVIRVRLTFFDPARPPRAEVMFTTLSDDFKRVVFEHVDSYRLPCIRANDPPLAATQEFQFVPDPNRAVLWNVPRETQQRDNALASACIVGIDSIPAYPSLAESAGLEASIFARYTFKDSRSAPDVEIVYNSGDRRFAQVVRDWAAQLRDTCLRDGDKPVRALQPFKFRMRGSAGSRFNDASLLAFLGLVAGIEQERIRFDFWTMGCPFEVAFVLRQPYLANQVGELRQRDEGRREFLEWLKTVKLALPPDTLRRVIGDSMTISVPCTVLDLTEADFPVQRP